MLHYRQARPRKTRVTTELDYLDLRVQIGHAGGAYLEA
jgi:hypothetical protein